MAVFDMRPLSLKELVRRKQLSGYTLDEIVQTTPASPPADIMRVAAELSGLSGGGYGQGYELGASRQYTLGEAGTGGGKAQATPACPFGQTPNPAYPGTKTSPQPQCINALTTFSPNVAYAQAFTTCPDGYVSSSADCRGHEAPLPNNNGTCPTGWTNSGKGVCVKGAAQPTSIMDLIAGGGITGGVISNSGCPTGQRLTGSGMSAHCVLSSCPPGQVWQQGHNPYGPGECVEPTRNTECRAWDPMTNRCVQSGASGWWTYMQQSGKDKYVYMMAGGALLSLLLIRKTLKKGASGT